MNTIKKEIEVDIALEQAFQKFHRDFQAWWPKAYTWSQEKLKRIYIQGKRGGVCTEIGPHDFRCDWGRVTAFLENREIGLKWQIGPDRTPIPDPELASDIHILFIAQDTGTTVLELGHYNFENHGEGAGAYLKMMDGEQGWEYILNCFKDYCEGVS